MLLQILRRTAGRISVRIAFCWEPAAGGAVVNECGENEEELCCSCSFDDILLILHLLRWTFWCHCYVVHNILMSLLCFWLYHVLVLSIVIIGIIYCQSYQEPSWQNPEVTGLGSCLNKWLWGSRQISCLLSQEAFTLFWGILWLSRMHCCSHSVTAYTFFSAGHRCWPEAFTQS